MKPFIPLLLLLCFLQACSTNTYIPLEDRYPMPWRQAITGEQASIEDVLLINNIHNCSQYYVRQSRLEPDDFLVACTEDNGLSWDYHVVVLSTEDVFTPDGQVVTEPVVF